MAQAHLDDAGLDLWRHLVRAAIGLRAALGKSSQAVVGVAHEPAMNGSPVNAIAGRNVGDGGPIQHLADGVVSLLNHRKLHKHDEILPGSVEHKS